MNLTDDEKLEQIKKWWSENGGSIVTGVVLGLAVLFGGKAWFSWQEKNAQNASNLYTVLMNSMAGGDAMAVSQRAGVLVTEYGDTPYAALASLALAKVRIEAGDLVAAQAQLEWVLENSKSDMLLDTARLRLARVLIAMENLDAAETLLNQVAKGDAFEPLYTEVRGDLYIARGNLTAANQAYQEALAATAAGSPGQHLLELKYRSTQVVSADSGALQE
ncbi:MAG: tetratricopeptide repeat protein [Gammaproteobacteria bacterium]|nr:tetratricopeptide repeat protein [Gammaproteobacteria bacterium]